MRCAVPNVIALPTGMLGAALVWVGQAAVYPDSLVVPGAHLLAVLGSLAAIDCARQFDAPLAYGFDVSIPRIAE